MDDEVDKYWLKIFHEEIIFKEPDLYVFGYRETNPKYKSKISLSFSRKFLSSRKEIAEEYIETLSGLKFNNGFVWNKVYKRDFVIFNGLKFTTNAIQQDELFNHKVYEKADTILISDRVLYDYYIYEEGNNRSRYVPERIQTFIEIKKSFLALKDILGINEDSFTNYIHKRFLGSCLFNRNPILTRKDKNFF